ncbi:MAG: DNA translocase FtsK 4TM domain-containing protein, partial [Prevotella sp.]|nr:DNA translocase FtsK 4TM domain-containing protein [Prevotella sp.]
MAKKKQAKTAKNFSEAIGFGNIFKNDIFNFIFGFVLLLLAVYVTIAFVSYFSTGQADQSLLLDRRPGELLNTHQEYQNSCGSIGAVISYFFISRCFGLSAFIIPVLMALIGLRMMHAYNNINLLKWFLCLVILMVWCSVTFAKFLTPIMGDQVFNPGGDHGMFCCQFLENIIGSPGLTAVLGLVAILFLTYLTTETITVIRKMLNPIGYIRSKVQFVITNDQRKEGTAVSSEPVYEPVMTYDEPEVEEPLVTEKEPDIIVEIPEKDQKVKPQGGQDTNDIDINVEVADAEEKANSKVVTTEVDLSTPINPR